MANTHLQFSETIECTKEQALWLQTALDIAVDLGASGDPFPACAHSYHADADYVWVHDDSSERSDIDALLLIVARFQLVFEIKKPWSVQWSWTCSKPRIGGFGGGAAVVYEGDIHFLDTWKWCCKKIYELWEG